MLDSVHEVAVEEEGEDEVVVKGGSEGEVEVVVEGADEAGS